MTLVVFLVLLHVNWCLLLKSACGLGSVRVGIRICPPRERLARCGGSEWILEGYFWHRLSAAAFSCAGLASRPVRMEQAAVEFAYVSSSWLLWHAIFPGLRPER